MNQELNLLDVKSQSVINKHISNLIQMSRSNFPPRPDGHLVAMSHNRDLEQKLTYQQLLNLNHDLTKENQQLKNISQRLGQQLRDLHVQFEIKPREQNSDLYNAIGNHPLLHNFQATLIPLFDAYEQKIQNFQHSFENIYEEFTMLEKKFQEVTNENESLKIQLTDKIKENIELYKTGSSTKLSSDFGQLVMQQVTQKHKILIEENSRLQTQYQRYKSQAEKNKRELLQVKLNYDQTKNKLKQIDIKYRNQQGELKISKQNCFTHQQRNNQLESQKTKLEQASERAQSQISTLIKERDFYLKKYDEYRNKMESSVSFGGYDQSHDRVVEELKSKISYLEAEKMPNDEAKKYNKLSLAYDSLQKQVVSLKETIDEIMMKKNQLADHNKQLEKQIDKLEIQTNELSISQSKLKVTVKQITERQKLQIEKFKNQEKLKLQSLQNQWTNRLNDKERKIEELEEELGKVTLEKYNLEKENQLFSGMESRSQSRPAKDSQRIIQKMTEKMNLNKDIMQQKIEVLKNENDHLKKQRDSLAQHNKSLKDQLKRIRQTLDTTTASLQKVTDQKARLTESIRKIRDEYDGELKEKEKIFHQRIEQIKRAIEESDKKRKTEREKVVEISRKYQNAVEELRRMYQDNPSFREESMKDKGSRMVF